MKSTFTIFHLATLDDKADRDRLNNRETGGWGSEPMFIRYADILDGDKAQAAVAWIMGEYRKVATTRPDTELETAFALSQHIEDDWTADPTGAFNSVVQREGGQRSTSVGDILEDRRDGTLWIVARCGFVAINLGDLADAPRNVR